MKLVFLTADDPLYLPAFFEAVLDRRAADTRAVYLVPPLYRNQTRVQAAWRYLRTFGFEGIAGLGRRLVAARLDRRSIAATCRAHGVESAVVEDVNAPAFVEHLRSLGPDLVVSVSCPQIFKRPLIEVGSRGCLNVHGAILPEYRGVMPSFWMLANGERRAGVTVYFVNEEIDAGDVCGQRIFDIRPDEALDGFLGRSKRIAAGLLLEVLEGIERGSVDPQPLDLAEGSYYSWPDRSAVKRFRAAGRRLW
jgi:methionyl-tRNA formyltransferase